MKQQTPSTSSRAQDTTLETLCSTLHELCQQVRLSTAGEDCLREATERLGAVRELLAPHTGSGSISQHVLSNRWDFEEQPEVLEDAARVMCYSPFIGRKNPVSLGFKLQVDEPGKRVSGSGAFPATSAGPPDSAHGGEIAGLFDELLSAVNWTDHAGGFTGTLTVRYHRLTPLRTPLELRAEFVERSGRKTIVKGDIRHRGEVTASAEAIFVRPKKPYRPPPGAVSAGAS